MYISKIKWIQKFYLAKKNWLCSVWKLTCSFQVSMWFECCVDVVWVRDLSSVQAWIFSWLSVCNLSSYLLNGCVFFLRFILCGKWSHILISGSQISTRHHCHPGYGWIVWGWQTDSCTCTKDPKIPFPAFPSCRGVYRSWWQTCSLEGNVYIVSCSTCYSICTLLLGLCTTVSSTKQLLQLSYMYMRIGRASHWNGVRIQGVSVISKPTLWLLLWYMFVTYLSILPQNSIGCYLYSKQDHGFM